MAVHHHVGDVGQAHRPTVAVGQDQPLEVRGVQAEIVGVDVALQLVGGQQLNQRGGEHVGLEHQLDRDRDDHREVPRLHGH